MTVQTSETAYTYRIRAENKAGWGEWSPMSAPRRGVNKPAAPTLSSVTPGDRSLTLGWSAGALNGASKSEVQYQYSVNGGSSWAAMPGNDVVTGLANGTNYNVRVRAVSTVSGTTYASDASNQMSGNPYGPLKQPSVTASQNAKSVTFGWNAAPAANGRDIKTVRIRIDGGGWSNVGASGNTTVGDGYSQRHTIDVEVTDTEGQKITRSEAGTSGAKPNPRAWVTSTGNANGQPGCSDGTCAYFYLNAQDFDPGQTITVQCNNNDATYGGVWGGPYSITMDGNGSYGGRLGCYLGNRRGVIEAWVMVNGTGFEHRAWQ
ncbi:MAG: hypothetical protein ACRDT7_08460 [Microbacterium sp.]